MEIFRLATPRSLCLLDEFGKGTLTEGQISSFPSIFSVLFYELVAFTLKTFMYISDGIGLLGGTINHFAVSDDPPKVGSNFFPQLPPAKMCIERMGEKCFQSC